MKILRANIYFILPDDFVGTFDQAIDAWRKYVKDAMDADHPNLSHSVSHEALFLNGRYGARTTAECGVWELYNRSWVKRSGENFLK